MLGILRKKIIYLDSAERSGFVTYPPDKRICVGRYFENEVLSLVSQHVCLNGASKWYFCVFESLRACLFGG